MGFIGLSNCGPRVLAGSNPNANDMGLDWAP